MKTETAPETDKPRPSRLRRILKRMVITILVLVVIFFFVVFPLGLAILVTGAGTRPLDRRLTETPADLGAEFKDVEFQTSDGVKISGWLLQAREGRATIIYSHGLFRSRRELLARALDLWHLGYGALLYDARNHGTSGKARVSLGYNERLDAEAAVRFVREEAGANKIVLFGISMGAATALLAAAETTEVAAVIADSSFLSFKDTTDHHLRMFLRVPPFPIANEVRFFMEWRADFDGEKLDALDAVKCIGDRPVFFIAGANDRRMPPDIARRLHEASSSPKRDLLIVDGPGSEIHGHAYQTDPKLYISHISRFLESALND